MQLQQLFMVPVVVMVSSLSITDLRDPLPSLLDGSNSRAPNYEMITSPANITKCGNQGTVYNYGQTSSDTADQGGSGQQ